MLDVPSVEGLSFTADAWRIDRTNLLGQRSLGHFNTFDTALLLAFIDEQLAAGVPINRIDLGSGTPNYRGDPDVERLPLIAEDIAAFAAYNAANPGNPVAPVGRIFARNLPFLNIAASEHRGVDFGARWVLPSQAWGRFVISSEWAYLDRPISVLVPTNVYPVVSNDLYADGAACWRSTTNLLWDRCPWNVGLGIYHVGKTHDAGATTTQAV